MPRIDSAFPLPVFPAHLRKMWTGTEVQIWLAHNMRLEVVAWQVTDRETGSVRYVPNSPGFVDNLTLGDSFTPLYSLTRASRE